MTTLVKLRLTQAKGTLRNLFAKPVSAIVTVLVVALYSTMLLPVLASSTKPPLTQVAASGLILSIVSFAFLLEVTTLLQKRKSLFFLGDAHYLYTSPFTHKQVLGAYALDLISSALLYGLISLVPFVMASMSGHITVLLLVVSFVVCTLVHYCILAVNGILYVRQLVHGKKSAAIKIVIAAIVVLVVGVAVYALVTSGFNWQQSLNSFIQSPLFNWVPLFGWARFALEAVVAGNVGWMLAGVLALVAACVAATAVLVNIKGDFYESSMQDAEAFTEYYQKARSGQNVQTEKVYETKMRFCKAEGAIFSKNLLVALKSRDFIHMQDIIILAIYIGMAFFMGYPYAVFSVMLMVWMFVMAGTSSLVDDLKHHYVYLIPGRPFLKLLSTLVVPFIKSSFTIILAQIAGGLLLQANAMSIVSNTLLCLSFNLVFMAGNVVSIRLLKSRTNKMAEQVLRMLIAAAALLPGLAVYLFAFVLVGEGATGLAAPILGGFNVAISVAIFALCAPMMKGNELNGD